MGRKRPQTPIFVQDIVVKSRSFPLFPPSFQHSTSVLHIPRGKKAHTPPFHNSSTAPSPKQRPQKIRMAAKRRRVFNTLPSPYYCYYNKYNKKQGKKTCIQQQTMRTLWGKRIKRPSGSGLRTESGQRSGRKERKVDPPPCVRFCQSRRGSSGRSPDRSPLPRPHGTRSGPSLLRSGSGAAQEHRTRSGRSTKIGNRPASTGKCGRKNGNWAGAFCQFLARQQTPETPPKAAPGTEKIPLPSA